MNKYKNDSVEKVLLNLHNDAMKDYMRIGKGMVKSIFRPLQPADFEQAYLPISKEQGKAIRQLVIKNDCKNLIEFGTSFLWHFHYLFSRCGSTNGRQSYYN